MRKFSAFCLLAALLTALAACHVLAASPIEEETCPPPAIPSDGCCALCIRPSIPLMLVRGYEESLSEALVENALTEQEQEDFLVEFQATLAVKQAKLDLLRAIHQLETVEKKCKGTQVADEAAELLKLLPQRKDLQPGQPATAVASRKRAAVARRPRATAPDATTTK